MWRYMMLVLMVGMLAGCGEVNHLVLKAQGCEDEALQYGYCHMPKALPR